MPTSFVVPIDNIFVRTFLECHGKTPKIPIIIIMLYFYSSSMSLSSWSSSLSTLGASCYYNITVVVILRWSFDKHIHRWYNIFIEPVWKHGTIDICPTIILLVRIIIISFYFSSSNSSSFPSIINVVIMIIIIIIFIVINIVINLLLDIYLSTIYIHRSYNMFIIH